MLKAEKTCCIAAVVITSFLARADAGISFALWDLGCGQVGANGVFVTQAPSPFSRFDQVMNGQSTQSALYTISYSPSVADIKVDAAISAPGGSNITTYADGRIRFVTDLPVFVTVDSFFNFAMPSGDREAIFSVLVTQRNPSALFFQSGGSSAPVFGDPPSGTWTANTNGILLPADREYELRYNMLFLSFSGSPTQLSQGNGSVHFTLHTVPEPATAGLLACSAGLLAHRRGKPRCVSR